MFFDLVVVVFVMKELQSFFFSGELLFVWERVNRDRTPVTGRMEFKMRWGESAPGFGRASGLA